MEATHKLAIIFAMFAVFIAVIIVVFARLHAKAEAKAGAGTGAGAANPEGQLEERMANTRQKEVVETSAPQEPEPVLPQGDVPQAYANVKTSAPQEPEPFLPKGDVPQVYAIGDHWDAHGETRQDDTQVDKTGVNDDQKCWSCSCTPQDQPAV